jgi:DAK2 domain fusion protein YloV
VVGLSSDTGRLERLDAQAARRWAVATRSAFAAHRAELDDLNVFPVPDGDTGTNLYITLDSALEAAREPRPSSPRPGSGVEGALALDAAKLARTTLLAARGNSGVILSQLVRGLSEVIAEMADRGVKGSEGSDGLERLDGLDGLDGPMLARAVRRASDLAYASVTRPVEGTILSVAAAAAGAAEQAAAAGSDLYAVVHASLAAARVALAATTAQLPVLARAGVVDAGGLGYVLVLEALELVIAGELAADPASRHPERLSTVALRAAAHAGGHGADAGRADGRREPEGPAYEVMYLLSESDEVAVAGLRSRLDALGDSVLVVGGEDLWNVHVHVDDVGAAIQAGIEAGHPHRIAVTHFGDQQRARSVPSGSAGQGAQGARGARGGHASVAVVACAAGEGLARVFNAAGAVPVFNGPGRRASAGQLLDAVRSASSHCVIVLPNDKDTLLAADAAASAAAESGIEVHVVRSRSAVQGLAALAVFEPAASGRDNLIAMSGAAGAARYGAVTVAAKATLTSAGRCHPGDVLGAVGGDVVVVGADLGVVAAEVAARLFADGGELLTLISGVGSGPELAVAVARSARDDHPDVEVSIIDGGQTTYPLLLGVE